MKLQANINCQRQVLAKQRNKPADPCDEDNKQISISPISSLTHTTPNTNTAAVGATSWAHNATVIIFSSTHEHNTTFAPLRSVTSSQTCKASVCPLLPRVYIWRKTQGCRLQGCCQEDAAQCHA